MGMFDRIMIDNTEYQTKAFGKSLQNYHIGDEVYIKRAPFTTEEYLHATSGKVLPNDTTHTTYQVECYCGTLKDTYINVNNNIITSIGARDEDVPLYDYYGKFLQLRGNKVAE